MLKRLHINNPPSNALDIQFLRQIYQRMRHAEKERNIRYILLESEKNTSFHPVSIYGAL